MGNCNRRFLSLVAATGLGATAAFAECSPDVVELRGEWGAARFRVELADDPAERARGLMHRDELGAGQGMLFVYEAPQPTSFWMRNTRIPLDMIFADAAGVVQRVHAEAVPFDETPIPGGDAIQTVLEINGGLAERIGIAPGTEMRHAAMPQEAAAWPCAETPN